MYGALSPGAAKDRLPMKVLVPVKRVVDANVKIRVLQDGSGVDLANVKMSMNPFDEIAVEQALRLREAGTASEVIAVTVGAEACQETLRAAMAMGADCSVLVATEAEVQPLAAAKLLAAVAEREAPGLIIMGKQAIDDDAAATGQMLAGLLGWSQGTFVSKLEIADGRAEVTREVDSGLESLSLALPAIVTTDLRLNEPRFASLPNIMKAKKKPIDTLSPEELGIDPAPRLETLRVKEPPKRQAGVRVTSAAELVAKLRDEAGVLS